MVHVLDLMGCVAVGPTTEEAIAATPESIRAYRRFLHRHGDSIDRDEPIETRVAEHITEGSFIGNGSPYILFAPDTIPVTQADIDRFCSRIAWLGEESGGWAASRTDAELDAPHAGSRLSREILRHVLAARAAGIASALGSSGGLNRIATAAERGEMPFAAAFDASTELIVELVNATTPQQRSTARQLPSGPKPLRQALRRILEHDWEHLAELSRLPGGPAL
jgi:predicted RNase H-like HicB family nuclease